MYDAARPGYCWPWGSASPSPGRYFKAKVLILDELTNHLSVKETAKVLGFVKGLAAQNVTGILISHNLHHVFVS
jgi:ABC-type sugar transport system ATPase subunit